MTKEEVILSRNSVLLKISWSYLIVQFILDMIRPDKSIVFTSIIGIIVFLVPTLLHKCKKLPELNMYIITLCSFIFLFFLNYLRPDLLNIFFIFLGPVVVSLLQNYRPIIFAAFLGVAEITYFFHKNVEVFPDYFVELAVPRMLYLVMMMIMVGLSLIFSSKFSEYLISLASKREGEAKYLATALNKMDAGALIIDFKANEPRIDFVNEGFTRLTGYTLEDLNSILPRGSLTYQKAFESVIKVKETGEKVIFESQTTKKDGTRFWSEISLEPIVNKQSNISYILCLQNDITERKNASRKLEEINNDVIYAGQIQKEILPNDFSNHQLSVSTIYKPLHYVSGDSFDYKWDDKEGKFYGILIDVMGHGFSTALQSSSLRVLFNQIINSGLSIEEKMKFLNQEASNYFSEDSYATLIYFEIDSKRNKLKVGSGGINSFLHLSNGQLQTLVAPGPFIGICDFDFEVLEYDYVSGDSVFFITDGIYDYLPDFSNAEGLRYQDVLKAFNEAADLENDDSSAICIQFKQTSNMKEYSISISDTSDVMKVRDDIYSILSEKKISDLDFVNVAINEALTNAVQHSKTCHLTLRFTRKKLFVNIIDSGEGFNGNERLEDIRNHKEKYTELFLHKTNGRGIYIINESVDFVVYNKKGNRILLVHNLRR